MTQDQWISVLRTVLALALAPTGYFVTKGFLTADQAEQLMPAIVTIATLLGGAIIAKWGVSAHSPAAQIAAVNAAPNGVKVVANTPANAAVPQVNAPLK